MTREEARAWFEMLLKDEYAFNSADREAFEMAIKALEQEPCGDAIGRQAALDLIKGFIADATSHGIYPRLDPDYVMDGIKALSPVTPQPKTGHWIIVKELHGEWESTKKYACDKCGEKVGVFKSNYCPNCGCRMIELQESEAEE